ncbi:hypothetical protein AMTRI_Chr06g195260 [Amborella trichopoda]
MAYIPPHKRHTKDTEKSTSSPSLLIPQLEESLNLGTRYAGSSGRSRRNLKRDIPNVSIKYSKNSISRWWDVGMSDDMQSSESPSVSLKPYPCELIERRTGEKPLAISLEGEGEARYTNRVHKTFYTNVPEEYVKSIECQAVPKLGLQYDTNKEKYYLKINDKMQFDVNLTCKCIKRIDGIGLELQKIETNLVRHLVVDISCLSKNVDLRLILVSKKILTELTEEEKSGIYRLVNSAVIDPNVKGKLRWPLKKEGTGDRFSIQGVWHTESKYFQGSTMKLKLRHADRYDFHNSSGEVSWEVSLKMQEITRLLMDQMLNGNKVAMEELQKTLKSMWEEFLSC